MAGRNWTALDKRGIPVIPPDASSAEGAPPGPCTLCPGGHPIDGSKPWEWCKKMDTCAATIDWESVMQRDDT
jgi:hypothetical protein